MLVTPEVSGVFSWQLTQENGSQTQGEIAAGKALDLGVLLPAGYHLLTLSQNGNVWPCRIIVVPPRCYEPEALLAGKNCGAQPFSFTRCARRITGASAILVT